MTQQDILRGAFDPETHKKHFVDYLEVIIRPDGVIEYAIPSHQEKLIAIGMQNLNVSRNELYDMCPTEYMFNVIDWLCKITDCISVWVGYHIGEPNEAQRDSLQMLKSHGLYKGKIERKGEG